MTTLADLTAKDFGRTVRIIGWDWQVVGPLYACRVETDWITDTPLDGSKPTRVPGRQTASVTVADWTAEYLPLTTRVEFS